MHAVIEDNVKESLQQLCQNILELDNLRFAGLINKQGNLFAGGFKKGIVPLEDDKKRRQTYVKLVLESCLRNDFNDSLGKFKYSTISREKVSIITMNVCDHLLLVFAEPDLDLHILTGRIQRLIDENETKYLTMKNQKQNNSFMFS